MKEIGEYVAYFSAGVVLACMLVVVPMSIAHAFWSKRNGGRN